MGKELIDTSRENKPRVILWDLEFHNLDANFGWLLCMGWKELGAKKVNIIHIAEDAKRYKADPTDDSGLVKKASAVLSTADMWVTWFGTFCDVPYMNTRLLYHNEAPLPPIKHVDGWFLARKKLKMNSNRLAAIQEFFGLKTEKTRLNPTAWRRVCGGHRQSLDYIIDHCVKDVEVLEQAYIKLRTLATSHPNLCVVSERDGCPICGAAAGSLVRRGWNIARTGRAQRFQCKKCGGWSHGPGERVKEINAR